MRKLFSGALVVITAAVFSANASAQCMIYSQNNYQGNSGLIQPNDFVKFLDKNFRHPQSGAQERALRTFTDVSWHNNVKSVQPTNGCRAIVMFGTDQDSADKINVYSSDQELPNFDGWVNVTGVYCQCQ